MPMQQTQAAGLHLFLVGGSSDPVQIKVERDMCEKYGFVLPEFTSRKIIPGNGRNVAEEIAAHRHFLAAVIEADIIIANCNRHSVFPHIDLDTQAILLMCIGLGKQIFGFTDSLSWIESPSHLHAGIMSNNGRIFEGDLDACLQQLRDGLDASDTHKTWTTKIDLRSRAYERAQGLLSDFENGRLPAGQTNAALSLQGALKNYIHTSGETG